MKLSELELLEPFKWVGRRRLLRFAFAIRRSYFDSILSFVRSIILFLQ